MAVTQKNEKQPVLDVFAQLWLSAAVALHTAGLITDPQDAHSGRRGGPGRRDSLVRGGGTLHHPAQQLLREKTSATNYAINTRCETLRGRVKFATISGLDLYF